MLEPPAFTILLVEDLKHSRKAVFLFFTPAHVDTSNLKNVEKVNRIPLGSVSANFRLVALSDLYLGNHLVLERLN